MARCDVAPLFNESVDEEFDAMLTNFVQGVEARFLQHLDLRSAAEPGSGLEEEGFDRALQDAMRAGARAALTPDILRSVRRKLNGDIPCSSARARIRMRGAPFRSVPEEFMFLVLKGARHGLTEADLASLPATAVGIRMAMDPSMRKAQVAGVSIFQTADAGRYLAATPSTWPQIASLGFHASTGHAPIKASAAAEAVTGQASVYSELFKEVAGLAKDLVLLIRDLLNCFRKVFEEIFELIKEGTKSAWKKISELWDDVKDDVQEEIDELEDDIRDLKKKVGEETDAEEKKKLEKELETSKTLLDKMNSAKSKASEAASEAKSISSGLPESE